MGIVSSPICHADDSLSCKISQLAAEESRHIQMPSAGHNDRNHASPKWKLMRGRFAREMREQQAVNMNKRHMRPKMRLATRNQFL